MSEGLNSTRKKDALCDGTFLRNASQGGFHREDCAVKGQHIALDDEQCASVLSFKRSKMMAEQ